MHYIYRIRNEAGEVIWVGQTSNQKRRLREHRKVFGLGISMEVICTIDADGLAACEQHWISHHRALGDKLHNKAKGGKGRSAVSEESRARMRAASKGRKMPDGHGARISAVTKGRPHNWTEDGWTRSSSSQFKPGQNALERMSEDARQRHRANSRKVAGSLTSEERSRRNAKAWANATPEQRAARCAAISRALTGGKSHWSSMTPEQRAATSAKISEKVRAALAAKRAG